MKAPDCQLLSSAMKRERERAPINRARNRAPKNFHSAFGTGACLSLLLQELSQNNVKMSLDSHGWNEIIYVHLWLQIAHSTYQVSLRVAHCELPSDPWQERDTSHCKCALFPAGLLFHSRMHRSLLKKAQRLKCDVCNRDKYKVLALFNN